MGSNPVGSPRGKRTEEKGRGLRRPTGSWSPGGLPAGRPPAPLDPPRLNDDVYLVVEAAGRGSRGGGRRHRARPAVLAAAQLT